MVPLAPREVNSSRVTEEIAEARPSAATPYTVTRSTSCSTNTMAAKMMRSSKAEVSS